MDDELSELAAAHGVATRYRDGDKRPVLVDPEVVIRVLGLLDVDASNATARRAALSTARSAAAAGRLPGTIAARTDRVRPLPAPGFSSAPTTVGTRPDGRSPRSRPA